MQRVRLFAGLLVIAAVVTAAWTMVDVERSSRATIQRRLQETREAWEALEANRYNKLTLGMRVLAGDPGFKAAILNADQATVYDMLKERGRDLGAALLIATNPSGLVLARTDQLGAHGADLSRDPSGILPVEGEGSATVWREGDRLFHAASVPMRFEGAFEQVSVPMRFGQALVGFLIAGYGIDQALADELRKITHSQVAFFVGAPGASRLSVSSLGPNEGASTVVPQLASATSESFEIDLGGERQIGIQVLLKTASGQTVGSVVFLRNLAEERAPFARLRIGTLVAALGLIALSLTTLVAAGRITRSGR